MLQPFDSAKFLFHRAAAHLAEFRTWYAIYLNSKPGEFVCEQDEETGLFHFKYRIVRQPPPMMGAITYDIVSCLRSALDHAVFDASVELGGNPRPKYTKFPFGQNAKEAADDLIRKRAEVPESIRPTLLGFRPYHPNNGGDPTLFGLNEIRNQKIHRILGVYVVQSGDTAVDNFIGGSSEVIFCADWNPERQEFTYCIAADPNVRQFEGALTLNIGLDEASTLGGKPAVEMLTLAANRVWEIIGDIAKETARLNAEAG